ncbi:ABC transporter permease subunit [Bacillus sp. 1P10SD]|uniref:ABC transporter permease subunit n=1 Tax=Bacillus sp. 1P10SD TaxID=3132265 RepID=UPI0039A5E9F5
MYSKKFFLPIRLIVILVGFISAVNLPILLTFNPYQIKIDIRFSFFKEYVVSNQTWFTHLDEYPWILRFFEGDGFHKYLYSMTILGASLLIVIILSLTIATGIMLLPLSVQKRFKGFIDFTTTIPDLLIIALLMYLVFYMNRTYHLKIFRLYGGVETEPYFIPIFIIIFVPTIFLTQLILKEYSTEEHQNYVLFARAKGLPLRTIYLKHIFRNIIPLILIHLKYIVWFMLSSIYVIERILNIKGYSAALTYMYGTRVVLFVVGLLLFSLPLVIVSAVGYVVKILMKRKETTSI